MSVHTITVITTGIGEAEFCCDPPPACSPGTTDICGGSVEVVIGGTCYNGTYTLTYETAVGYTNATVTALIGTNGVSYCASVLIIDCGQASYEYSGSDNPCTTLVVLDFVTSDGICEAGDGCPVGAWPSTITLGPP